MSEHIYMQCNCIKRPAGVTLSRHCTDQQEYILAWGQWGMCRQRSQDNAYLCFHLPLCARVTELAVPVCQAQPACYNLNSASPHSRATKAATKTRPCAFLRKSGTSPRQAAEEGGPEVFLRCHRHHLCTVDRTLAGAGTEIAERQRTLLHSQPLLREPLAALNFRQKLDIKCACVRRCVHVHMMQTTVGQNPTLRSRCSLAHCTLLQIQLALAVP